MIVSLWEIEPSAGVHRDRLERLCLEAEPPIEITYCRHSPGRAKRCIPVDRVPDLLDLARRHLRRRRRRPAIVAPSPPSARPPGS